MNGTGTQRIRVALYDARPYDREFFDEASSRTGFDIAYLETHLTPDTCRLAEGSQAVCAFVNDTINAPVITALHHAGVELIALRSTGYNNVDLQAAYRRIHVVRVPAYSPHAVAEHALALLLTLNRHTHKAYYRSRDNNFSIVGLMGFDLHGKTAGVIGTGAIGRVLIPVLVSLGMEVLASDPVADQATAARLGFTYIDRDELYRRADVISLHCPLTRETFHMIDARSIARMKDGVYIINTGRGRLIDTGALIQGLKKGKIGAAGLDVYEEESEFFYEDFSTRVIADDTLARLLTFANVLITSHQGFFTREALQHIAATTVENLSAYFGGTALHNEICYRCGQDPSDCSRQRIGRCF